MSNNLQALKVLKKSAREQNRELESSIKEIHKESLEQLSSDLKDIINEKLEKIEKDIKEKNETTIKKIENKLEQLRKNKIRNYIIIVIISLIVGGMLTRILYPWIVPEQMRYKQGEMKYIQSKNPQTVDGITYIQLEGK